MHNLLKVFFVAAVLLFAACVTNEKGGVFTSESKGDVVEARVTLALQYLFKRDFEAARRNLKIAYELAPKNADVHDAMAHTFVASGEVELADKHYRLAVNYGGDTSRYRFNYANFLLRAGKFEETEKILNDIVDDSLYEKRDSALVLLGLTQLQLLKTAEAKRSFERALILSPKNGRVLRELSIMLFDEGQFAKSQEYFGRYRQQVRQLNAEMLLLGIHLAEQLGDKNGEASYALALRNLYPDSKEYASYQRGLSRK